MLLDKDDVPIIITRSGAGGKSGIYRPTKPLVPNTRSNLPQLEKVGEFAPAEDRDVEPAPGARPDVRDRGGEVAGRQQGRDPHLLRRVRVRRHRRQCRGRDHVNELPSHAAAGRAAGRGDQPTTPRARTSSLCPQKPAGATENPKLLRYQPFVPAAGPTGDPADNLPPAPGENKSWFDKLTFNELTRLVAAVGVVGLVLAIAGIVGIRRARRRRREEEEYDDYDDYDDEPQRRRGGRGRSREDDHSFAGLRDSALSGQPRRVRRQRVRRPR